MRRHTQSTAYVEQARQLAQVLERLATCTPADSLERAELVERLTKLLKWFEQEPYTELRECSAATGVTAPELKGPI